MARQTRRAVGFRFAFLGFRDGWYLLRADMSKAARSMDALGFEGQVTTWLVEQSITPGKWSHFGAGNTGEYPIVPEDEKPGSALYLLLKRPADVIRLSENFACTNVTDDTLLEALRAEAAVHRFTVGDIVRLVEQAIIGLLKPVKRAWPLRNGELDMQVRRRLNHPGETVEALHAAWMEPRQKDGWKYGSNYDLAQKRDPGLVPFRNLDAVGQARYRLVASMVDALAPLIGD